MSFRTIQYLFPPSSDPASHKCLKCFECLSLPLSSDPLCSAAVGSERDGTAARTAYPDGRFHGAHKPKTDAEYQE